MIFSFALLARESSSLVNGFLNRSIRTNRKLDFECLSRLKSSRENAISFGFKKLNGSSLKVLKYPDPKLRAENQIISVFDDDLKKLAQDMLKLMYEEDGIGLAAPQVGINKRLMVFNEAGDANKKSEETVLINPKIISKSEETDIQEEGCLSFPMMQGRVIRNLWVEVEYQNIEGVVGKIRYEDFAARLFQHEYDHLDKVLLVDRFLPEDVLSNKKRIDKFIKKYGPGGSL